MTSIAQQTPPLQSFLSSLFRERRHSDTQTTMEQSARQVYKNVGAATWCHHDDHCSNNVSIVVDNARSQLYAYHQHGEIFHEGRRRQSNGDTNTSDKSRVGILKRGTPHYRRQYQLDRWGDSITKGIFNNTKSNATIASSRAKTTRSLSDDLPIPRRTADTRTTIVASNIAAINTNPMQPVLQQSSSAFLSSSAKTTSDVPCQEIVAEKKSIMARPSHKKTKQRQAAGSSRKMVNAKAA